MMKSLKKCLVPGISLFLILGLFLAFMLSPAADYSESERRELHKAPALKLETVLNGQFMNEFEAYALDQFPLRDSFRALKALFSNYVLLKKDNHQLYVVNGSVGKLEYQMHPQMVDHALERFAYNYQNYMEPLGIHPYIVMVPDKNYYMASSNGYPSLDYDAFYDYVADQADFLQQIDVRELLTIEDYYRTDSHWKQECIVDVANRILSEMNAFDAHMNASDADLNSNLQTEPDDNLMIQLDDFDVKELDRDFYGVYYGQAALPLPPDRIRYLTNAELEGCRVESFDTGKGKPSAMYVMEKAMGKDPYEMFLNGSTPVIKIDNPAQTSGRRLIMYRDSFGSSIAPLLVHAYSEITLVDIRYVQSTYLSKLIDFEGADVLFLYSTTLINNSMGLR